MLDTANRALMTGLAMLALILLLAILGGKLTSVEAGLYVARGAHVFAAMVWVGLIWFVNTIQMEALEEAREPDRKVIMTWITPSVGFHVGRAATMTFLTGAVMMIALGYFTQRSLTGSPWLWAGVIGGTAMVAFVHAKIAPAMRIVLDSSITDVAVKSAARSNLRIFARINLLLAFPVTFAMLAGAHG